jgi:hypothetical protein
MSRLRQSVEDLSRWLRERGAPCWADVAIVELSRTAQLRAAPGGEHIHVSRSELRTVASYQARFEQLLDQGHAWINLSAFGFVGDTLLITVETPRSSASAQRTSVNLSGPPTNRGWDATRFVVFE